MSPQSKSFNRGSSDNGARGIFLSDSDTKERDGDMRKTSSLSRPVLGNQTKTSSCRYPEHKGERKCGKTDRAFSVKLSREVMEVFGVLDPVGARKYCDI